MSADSKNRNNLVQTAKNSVSVNHREMQLYSGPIPPASELMKYENVLPGSAERILKMAEKQSDHRRSMESKALEAGIKAERTGQLIGFLIFFLALIAGFVLMVIGKDAIGLVTSLSSLASIIGLFIYIRRSEKKELEGKDMKTNR